MSAVTQDAPRGFVAKADYYAALRRIDELTEQRDALERELRALQAESQVALLRGRLRLAPQEARLVARLWAARKPVKYDVLAEATGTSGVPRKVVNVLMFKIRAKMFAEGAPSNWVIIGHGPYGEYQLSQAGRAWLREILGEST